MTDSLRRYHVVTFPRRSPVSFAGPNAKRDALSLARRDGGTARPMTGAQWSALCERNR